MSTKRGEAGIGTLILLIALILVAAIAASVLLVTQSSLQSKALAAGSKSETQVSSGIVVMQVWGENGSTNALNYVYGNVRLSAASDPINFNNTLVYFDLSDASLSANYVGTFVDCNESAIDNMVAINSSSYAVQYVINATTHIDGYLQQGEIAKICFAPPHSMIEKVAFRFTVLPKSGALTQVRGSTPDAFTDARVIMFPN